MNFQSGATIIGKGTILVIDLTITNLMCLPLNTAKVYIHSIQKCQMSLWMYIRIPYGFYPVVLC